MTTETKKTTPKKTVTPNDPLRPSRVTPIVIDATNLVVGRMASLVAEQLLKGAAITIVNTEKAVFTGNTKPLVQRWQTRLDLRAKGTPEHAPRFHKTPDRIVREIVEGMVPSRVERGQNAMRRLKTLIGVPLNVKKETLQTLEKAKNTKTKGITSVLELSRALGYNQIVKG
ncbi:MAG: 50S ribosomal protein L13 [archaeon]